MAPIPGTDSLSERYHALWDAKRIAEGVDPWA
jgi:hypothetical protein